jgi:protoheme IX farnesyltransferase
MTVGSRPLVPSRLAPGRRTPRLGADERSPLLAHAGRRTPTTTAGAYIALTKPRIIELLLVTTIPTMVLAERGWPSLWLMLVTLVGGTLAAGGANAINMYVDRDIDAKMLRTQNRPLVTGVIEPRNALVFAIVLEAVSFVVLWAGANLLSAVLALSATAFYVGVYTLWLKRTSRHNIVIGGAAGAMPVLVGWAAVTGSLGWAPLVLFAAMFFWTPPHFWALAIRYSDDYRAADVPMLPAVAPHAEAARQMIGYTVALVVSTLVLVPVADLGWIYATTAAVLGAGFLAATVLLARDPEPSTRAMRVFTYSITYVTVLFAALMIDVLVLG